MVVIKVNGMVIYRAAKGKKLKFANDPKETPYDEISLKEENDQVVEVE